MVERIAVLGAGAGGCATAAHMSLKGYKINLYELPRFKENIEFIKKHEGITICGEIVGFAELNMATTNIKEAVKDVDIVIIAVQSQGQREMAEKCIPFLEDGQIVSYLGEPAGSLEFAKVIRSKDAANKEIIVGETCTLPYDALRIGPGAVKVLLKKGGTTASSFPAKNNSVLVKGLKELWPFITSGTNVFETILLNYNAIDHIPPGLLNVGTLETPGVTRYWGDGCTPGVARAIEAVSNESIAMRKSLGFKDLRPYRELLYAQGFLESPKTTTYDSIMSSLMAKDVRVGRLNWLREDRLIIESLPYGLRLMSSIGDLLDVKTPIMDALITIGSVVNEVDYWKEGRTAEKLGIPKGLNVEDLNRFLYEGEI